MNRLKYGWIFLIGLALFAAVGCAPIPKLIEQESSWMTIAEPDWEPVWRESFRSEEKRTVLGNEVTVKTTSRATAWYSESQKAGFLALSTPNIKVYGVSLNPFKTQSDEWVLRELAKQGGSVAREKLAISFESATVPLAFQETVTASTLFGAMQGSRFLARTPEGDGYVTVLRGIHEKDLLVLISAAQSLSVSQTSTAAAASLRHPSAEPQLSPIAPAIPTLRWPLPRTFSQRERRPLHNRIR